MTCKKSALRLIATAHTKKCFIFGVRSRSSSMLCLPASQVHPLGSGALFLPLLVLLLLFLLPLLLFFLLLLPLLLPFFIYTSLNPRSLKPCNKHVQQFHTDHTLIAPSKSSLHLVSISSIFFLWRASACRHARSGSVDAGKWLGTRENGTDTKLSRQLARGNASIRL